MLIKLSDIAFYRPGYAFLAKLLLLYSCSTKKPEKPSSEYLNHHDSARYVGIQVCRGCHANVYENFVETGMGKSFDVASRHKSSGVFNNINPVYDKDNDFYYYPFWREDSLFFTEFRLNGTDTVYKRTECIDFIIGSGQHTNSHMIIRNGKLTQAPLTFYTQKNKWDLPPGFENGNNTRFNRKIELECMSCHNAFPEITKGSMNLYTKIEKGIDCERCHGPGSVHVALKMKGERIDTSKFIDYSIVNPGKLDIERQFDICQRCHLQGNAVLKNGRDFFDFKPGKKLSDYMTVFLPRYEHADEDFIMASHADRIKQSKCFTESLPKSSENTGIRPYKNALTCVTCHNPHISSRKQGDDYFNKKCANCHSSLKNNDCTNTPSKNLVEQNNCVKCHMPKSGSTDIPHVTVHDHYIRKPSPSGFSRSNKKFRGLFAINDIVPGHLVKAEAYLNQFEKFHPDSSLLDSAAFYLKREAPESPEKKFKLNIRLLFLSGRYSEITRLTNAKGNDLVLNKWLVNRSWSNEDAWTLYRIGESLMAENQFPLALKFLDKSLSLAPYIEEFKLKKGLCLHAMNRPEEAYRLFKEITETDPQHAPAWNNLGYMMLLNNDFKGAEIAFNRSLKLDPDYEKALLNMASLMVYQKKKKEAVELLKRVIKISPGNIQAKKLLKQTSA